MTLRGLIPALLCLSLTVSAQVPQIIGYQGSVTVSSNKYTGTGQFKFALVSSDGSTTYWSNDNTSNNGSEPANAVSLGVTNGLFSVFLGDNSLANMTPIPSSVFLNNDVRLRIWFNDVSHGSQQLTPDQRFGATGYAMMAANVPSGSITASQLATGSIGSAQLASGAAQANLQNDGFSAVPSGGVILSTNPNPSTFANAGYTSLGKTSFGELWQAGPNNAPLARANHTTVWTGNEMMVWGGVDATDFLNTGGRYDASANTWTSIPTANAPGPRDYHSAVWTGSEMIIWGGYVNGPYTGDGARFNPSANTWTPVSNTGAPSPRDAHTAVWTGSEMVIWGGFASNGVFYFKNGARYNPSTDTWRSVSSTNAPSARYFHTAVWTGSEMIVWGGSDGDNSYLLTGARYNPTANTWTKLSTNTHIAGRYLHSAVWTGNKMIVWGGYGTATYLGDGASYDPNTDTWTALTMNGAPEVRYSHTAVWSGSEMIIWGGYHFGFLQTGARYNPPNNTWQAMSAVNVPSARDLHSAVWSGSDMIIWGGSYGPTNFYNDLARYVPARDMYLYGRP